MSTTLSTLRSAVRPSRPGRRTGVLLIAFVVLSLIGASAWAYWSTTGTGTGSAATSTLNAPTGVLAGTTSGSSTVNVSWTAPSGGSAPQGYYVTRTRTSDSTTAQACGTSAGHLTSALSCADTSVPDGTYTYSVTAVLNSWSATSNASSNVTVASVRPATKLAFTTQPGNGTGGSALATQPVVTVQDAAGNTVTGDTSSVTLALTTPGGATLSCTANPKAAVAGVATFAGCKVDRAGTYTLTATDGSLTSATSTSFTISVGAAFQLAFTTQPGNGTGGSALATQPVVTVQDAGGNTVTSDTSKITLSLSGGAANAKLTCNTNPINAINGVASFSGCSVDKVANGYTLTARSQGGLSQATSASFNIT